MAARTLLFLLFTAYAVPAAAVPILSIVPSSPTVTAGDSFTLDVSITDVTDLFAFQFDVTFDPLLLASNGSTTEGPFLATGGSTFFIAGDDTVAGSIVFTANSLIGFVPGVTGDGVLATINLLALAAGTSPITLSGILLLDSALSEIAFETLDGSVDVLAQVPEPSALLLLATGFAGARRWQRRARVQSL